MELTEFLVARIAEDEAPTWELVPYRCDPSCCAPAGFVGHRCHICNTEEFGGTVAAITALAQEHDEAMHGRSRMLAECEAKRLIVAVHGPIDNDPEPFCWNCDEDTWPCKTMAALALPHADHADYDERWRP